MLVALRRAVVFAVQYPISLKGLSCGMCMVYGKIAGENAAAGK